MRVLWLLPLLVGCERAPARAVDFIAADARVYFDADRSALLYGPARAGWRLGLSPFEPAAYVVEGGLGEPLPFGVSAFTSDEDWSRWSGRATLNVRVRVAADDLPDAVYEERLGRETFAGNRHGSMWGSKGWLRLHELRAFWTRLPSEFRVSLALAEPGLPPAASPEVAVRLVPVPAALATWSQRVASLRRGQPADEVKALLGPPLPGSKEEWLYVDPEAPAHLRPEERRTIVHLDTQGHFLSAYRSIWGC